MKYIANYLQHGLIEFSFHTVKTVGAIMINKVIEFE